MLGKLNMAAETEITAAFYHWLRSRNFDSCSEEANDVWSRGRDEPKNMTMMDAKVDGLLERGKEGMEILITKQGWFLHGCPRFYFNSSDGSFNGFPQFCDK